MRMKQSLALLGLMSLVAGCSGSDDSATTADDAADSEPTTVSEANDVSSNDPIRTIEIAPGLTAKVLKEGEGKTAAAGDNVTVHYTGWLYDEAAENNRGDMFDSSVERGQHFQFPLGVGRVIQGWDQGVAGMAIGEVRELTIAPEMGYGDRGAGTVIPPGATLIFEVELFDTQTLPTP